MKAVFDMISRRLKLVFFVSVIVLVLAIVLSSWGIPKIIQKKIKENIQLDESSTMYEKWRKMPMPLQFKVYLFNVTNVEDINDGAKPKLNEIGPYVYDEYRERTILGTGNNDTIRYTLKKTFIFNQTASGDWTEFDDVIVIHLPYLASVMTVQEIIPGISSMINPAFELLFEDLVDPFLRVKVKDLLFDGIFMNCEGDNTALSLVCGRLKMEPPSNVRPAEDRNGYYVSMFGQMNLTESGPYEMVRGIEDITQLGNIVSYKNKTNMNNWKDPYCGRINGSDSSIFPPLNENSLPDKVYSFEPDFCRSMYASLVGKDEIYNIPAYRYEISTSLMASRGANPDNKCFCRRRWGANRDGCLLMGVMNLMPCQGAPIIASYPHFYLASEELLEYFDGGIMPNKSLHETYVYIEPNTGALLDGKRRLQFNVELRNINVPQLENVTSGLFPLLWIEEGATLPPELINEVKSSLSLLSYAHAIRWIFLAFAISFCGLTILVLIKEQIGFCSKNKNSVNFIMTPNMTSK